MDIDLFDVGIGVAVIIFVLIIKLFAHEADEHEDALRNIIEHWNDDEEE